LSSDAGSRPKGIDRTDPGDIPGETSLEPDDSAGSVGAGLGIDEDLSSADGVLLIGTGDTFFSGDFEAGDRDGNSNRVASESVLSSLKICVLESFESLFSSNFR
jgi:hypothetical protein